MKLLAKTFTDRWPAHITRVIESTRTAFLRDRSGISTDPHTATLETHAAILGAVRLAAGHWISRQLTTIGRVHVVKQVLASKGTYHATFIPTAPTPTMAKEPTTYLVSFVGGAGPTLRPGRAVFALPREQGGMRLIQPPDMEPALQVKVVSRLFEPERLVWKDFAAISAGPDSR